VTHEPEVHDVAIVGCGPVGAVMANLLGQAGLRVVVYEIGSSVYHLPRAAHFDAEIMRVFQAIRLAEAVLPATRPIEGMHFLNGARKKLFGFDAPPGTTWQGWPSGFLFYQPDLETALRDGLARFPLVSLRYQHEVLSFGQDEAGVEIRVRDLVSGAERVDRARYLLGADGGRSTVRKIAGMELEDMGFDQPWLVIDTMVKRDVTLPRVALQICDPSRPATFIPSAGRHRRWEFMLMSGDTVESMERPERVEELLRPWISLDETEVTRAVVYTFHALIAKQWRDRRVLILGDAAHQMPPFLGQGMCSGIRDAHNLSWKLRMALSGAASVAILDTYQQERAPHVRAIIERAVGFGRLIQTTDPAIAAARDAQFLANGGTPPGGDAMSENRMPPLGDGIRAKEAPAGELFAQPVVRLGDGTEHRLDDVLGGGFAVVGLPDRAAALVAAAAAIEASTGIGARAVVVTSPSSPPRLPNAQDAILVEDAGTKLVPWLNEHGAAIVRPDRYVFGAARTDDGLAALARALSA
jgi:3-(3-hydroxy-phenyl)propionate hydroxylase